MRTSKVRGDGWKTFSLSKQGKDMIFINKSRKKRPRRGEASCLSSPSPVVLLLLHGHVLHEIHKPHAYLDLSLPRSLQWNFNLNPYPLHGGLSLSPSPSPSPSLSLSLPQIPSSLRRLPSAVKEGCLFI